MAMNGEVNKGPASITDTLGSVPVVGALLKAIWGVTIHFMEEYRGWFVFIFVLPFSKLFDIFFRVRSAIIMKLFSAPELHAQRVKAISDQLKDLKAKGHQGKLVTARGGWQSTSIGFRPYKKHATAITIDLYDILELDTKNMTVKVEPYVSMGQLTRYLAPRGYRIPVTPELDDLTVGGLYMGVGIESCSTKCGLFDDDVVACEVVLADGTVMNCSETENRELFDALPWSYGTLGFLVSATIRIVPCKPFVRLEYIPCLTTDEGIEELNKAVERDADFVEALQYSLDKSVVMVGNLVDESQAPRQNRNDINVWYKPWFYKHVESFLGMPKAGHYVEYIPTRSYFHRHTKSIFWEMEDIVPFGNSAWFRYLFGWYLPVKVSFLKLTQTPQIRKMYEEMHVVQDMLIPMKDTKEGLEVFHNEWNIYPMWLCPYKAFDQSKRRDQSAPHRHFLRKPSNVEPGKDYEMYIDIGVYGTPKAVKEKKPFNNVEALRRVEKYVLSKGGFQMMYAESHLSREEFRKMFDHSHYDEMKAKYDPNNAFPKIYEKTCKHGMQHLINTSEENKKTK